MSNLYLPHFKHCNPSFSPPETFFWGTKWKNKCSTQTWACTRLIFSNSAETQCYEMIGPTSFCKTCRPNLVLTKWFAQTKINSLRDGNKLTGHKSLQNVSFFIKLCSEIYMGPTISKWKCSERYNLCTFFCHVFFKMLVSWVGTAHEHVRICFNISIS